VAEKIAGLQLIQTFLHVEQRCSDESERVKKRNQRVQIGTYYCMSATFFAHFRRCCCPFCYGVHGLVQIRKIGDVRVQSSGSMPCLQLQGKGHAVSFNFFLPSRSHTLPLDDVGVFGSGFSPDKSVTNNQPPVKPTCPITLNGHQPDISLPVQGMSWSSYQDVASCDMTCIATAGASLILLTTALCMCRAC
jgi:hypothetical protein